MGNPVLAQQLLEAFDQLQGVHPGFRPAHAKGLMCSGVFAPSAEAAKLTRAPHANQSSTPVTVRYSDSTGLPNIPDNDPARSGPRGIAVRFHLDEHLHTDIVAHSYDGFPVRTGEEFLEFLRAAAAFGSGRPEVMGGFLAAHPNAKRFVETPKPIPTSFARGRPSSLAPLFSSPTPVALADTADFASGPMPGRSTSPMKQRRQSLQAFCSTKWVRTLPGSRTS